jgi:hypothetical protein
MADAALCPEKEQLAPQLGRFGHGALFVLVFAAVVRRVPTQPSTLVVGDGVRDALFRDLLRSEGLLEVRLVTRHSRKILDHLLMRVAHLDGVCDWLQHLLKLVRLRYGNSLQLFGCWSRNALMLLSKSLPGRGVDERARSQPGPWVPLPLVFGIPGGPLRSHSCLSIGSSRCACHERGHGNQRPSRMGRA